MTPSPLPPSRRLALAVVVGLPLIASAACGRTPSPASRPEAGAKPTAAAGASAPGKAAARGTKPGTNGATPPGSTARPGAAASSAATSGTATTAGTTGRPAASTAAGTRPAAKGGSATAPANTLDAVLLRAELLGQGWRVDDRDAAINDPGRRHEYCAGPFRSDEARTERRGRDFLRDNSRQRVQEEANRYRPGGAKAALAEFREQFEKCASYATGKYPQDFKVTMTPAPAAPRIGTDSESREVHYQAGPYAHAYTVLTVAIQGDVLLMISSVGATFEEARAVAASAVPAAAEAAGFRVR